MQVLTPGNVLEKAEGAARFIEQSPGPVPGTVLILGSGWGALAEGTSISWWRNSV